VNDIAIPTDIAVCIAISCQTGVCAPTNEYRNSTAEMMIVPGASSVFGPFAS